MKGVFEKKDLKITGVITDRIKPYEPMFHSHGEILYVSDGNLAVNIDGNKRLLSSGEMCIVFPYAVHSYEPVGRVGASYVLFSAESAGEFADILFSKKPANPFFIETGVLLMLIEKVIQYSCDNSDIMQKTTGAYLKALLGEILSLTELYDVKKSEVDTVCAVMSYCSEHYCEDIKVKDVAENVFVSERYVTKIFAEKVGCSFRDYINSLRVSRVKYLINNNSMRITDIMYECGFKNQSTFNRVFLEVMGCSPREYRNRSR